jgi:hypothetical protein
VGRIRLLRHGQESATYRYSVGLEIRSVVQMSAIGDLIVCAVLTPWDSTNRRFAVKRLDRDGNLIWQVNSDSIAPGVSQIPLLARAGTLLSIGCSWCRFSQVFYSEHDIKNFGQLCSH